MVSQMHLDLDKESCRLPTEDTRFQVLPGFVEKVDFSAGIMIHLRRKLRVATVFKLLPFAEDRL